MMRSFSIVPNTTRYLFQNDGRNITGYFIKRQRRKKRSFAVSGALKTNISDINHIKKSTALIG